MKMKMKVMKFRNIHSLEDLHRQKVKLKKKLSLTEQSISSKTDIGKLLVSSSDKISGSFSEPNGNIEILGALLPIGIKYLTRQIKKNPDKKKVRKLLIYLAIGGAASFMVYKFIRNRNKADSEQ